MKKSLVFSRRCLGVLCLLALVFGVAHRPSARAEMQEADFKQWSLLAVQDEGRLKPLDTFARESLLRLTGGSLGMAVYKDTTGKLWKPNDWLFSVFLGSGHDWKKEPMVLVAYRPLIQKLGLDPARKRFSFEELTTLPALDQATREIQALRSRESDPQLSREQQEVESVRGRLQLLVSLINGDAFAIVPRPAATNVTDNPALRLAPAATAGAHFAASTSWLVLSDEARNLYGAERFNPVTSAVSQAVQADQTGDKYQFARHARLLREGLRALNPGRYPTDAALNLEYTYNHLAAFGWATAAYALGALGFALAIGVAGVAGWARVLGLVAGLAGLATHAVGIGLRCAVAGRPPVTNMYESLLWVALVVVACGFAFYWRYRGELFLLAALPVGAGMLGLVQGLPVALPGTIEPLRPVLRDNFWLTTHVLTETASYGAFALAMAFGHLLLWRYIVDPLVARRESTLHFWLYRTLQLGVLLITVGTVLGAVWANYSWGRYWGWDPKETWALITLLCYLAAIHGRIAGYWGQFGLAIASVLCFGAVVMAWYGVNFVLGKGLHSYGRGVGGEGIVTTLLVLDAIFLGVAVWRYRQGTAEARLVPQ